MNRNKLLYPLFFMMLFYFLKFCSADEFIEAIKSHKLDLAKQLIKKGADLSATDSDGKTALHWSISRPGLPLLLLQAGADPNAMSKTGWNPLHECAGQNRSGFSESNHQTLLDSAIILLQNGLDPNIRTRTLQKQTALMLAADQGSDDIIRALIKYGAKLDLQDDDGRTALHHAVLKSTNAVRSLLEAGASVHVKDINGQTALMHYASEFRQNNSDQAVTARLLVQAGTKIEEKDNYRQTALMLAIQTGNREIKKVLLEVGADTSDTNFYELMNALDWEDLDRVTRLMGKVNLNRSDASGTSPLELAAKHGSPEIVSILIEAGAQVDITDTDGMTPLLLASDYNNSRNLPEMVTTLLDAGANPNHTNNEGETALSIAINSSQGMSFEIPNLLIKAGSDPKLINTTDLIYVVWHGRPELMEALLTGGVDVNKEITNDNERITLLSAAVKAERPEMVRLLLKHGAVDNRVMAEAQAMVRNLEYEEAQAKLKTTGSLQHVVIQLKRTACEGTCPDYQLTVNGDGKVEYIGKSWVDIAGLHQYKIPIEDVRKILLEAERVKFFEYKPKAATVFEYDVPTTTITMQFGTQSQSSGDRSMPGFDRFADQIEELSGASHYIKTTPDFIRDLYRRSEASMSSDCSDSINNAIQLRKYDLLRAWGEVGCDFNITDTNGHKLLDGGDDLAITKLLMKFGAVPTSSALQGTELEVLQFLINHGAKPPLDILLNAVPAGSSEEIELLIHGGADINARDKNGNTPLLVAAANRNLLAVEALLKNKADIHVIRSDGLSPLEAICSGLGFGAYSQNKDAIEVLKALLTSSKMNIEELNRTLLCAARKRDFFMSKILLNAGANPAWADSHGVTAISIATSNGFSEIIQLINEN